MMTAFESLTPSTFSQPLKLKQWTVADYHRMAELNLLRPGERTELLEGQISLMAAKGTAHVLALRILSQLLEQLMAGKSVFISTQDPIQLNDFSEPEPDLAIIYGNFFDFSGRHPQPKDIALVVEIADSSVKHRIVRLRTNSMARLESWITGLWIFRSSNFMYFASHQNQAMNSI